MSSQWVKECDLSESAYGFDYIEVYQATARFIGVGAFRNIMTHMERYPMKAAGFNAATESAAGSPGLGFTAVGVQSGYDNSVTNGTGITLTNGGTHLRGEFIVKVVGYK